MFRVSLLTFCYSFYNLLFPICQRTFQMLSQMIVDNVDLNHLLPIELSL
jgi:hypothetical protein